MREIYFSPEEPKTNLDKWEIKALLMEGKDFFRLIQDVMDNKEDKGELNTYLKYHPNLLKILIKWTENRVMNGDDNNTIR